MKRLLLVIMLLANLSLFAQESVSNYIIGVRKNGKLNGKVTYFKSNKKLEIYTKQGRMVSGNFTLTENEVIFNGIDTIPVNEISIIKGRIKKSFWTKAGAWSIITGGTLIGEVRYSLDRWASGWSTGGGGLSASLPFFMIAGAGVLILVIDKKTYDTLNDWELIIIDK